MSILFLLRLLLITRSGPDCGDPTDFEEQFQRKKTESFLQPFCPCMFYLGSIDVVVSDARCCVQNGKAIRDQQKNLHGTHGWQRQISCHFRLQTFFLPTFGIPVGSCFMRWGRFDRLQHVVRGHSLNFVSVVWQKVAPCAQSHVNVTEHTTQFFYKIPCEDTVTTCNHGTVSNLNFCKDKSPDNFAFCPKMIFEFVFEVSSVRWSFVIGWYGLRVWFRCCFSLFLTFLNATAHTWLDHGFVHSPVFWANGDQNTHYGATRLAQTTLCFLVTPGWLQNVRRKIVFDSSNFESNSCLSVTCAFVYCLFSASLWMRSVTNTHSMNQICRCTTNPDQIWKTSLNPEYMFVLKY